MPTLPRLTDVVDLLHGWYPPATADSWDAVGLVAGDPGRDVRKVLFAVDPAPAVAQEAAEWGADLLVVHHPLFLKPVHGIARTTPKARTLGVLLDAGCALLTAHTNADQAVGGVSEALATTLGLTNLAPVVARDPSPVDKLTVYVPVGRCRAAPGGAGRRGRRHHRRLRLRLVQHARARAGSGRRAGANPAIGEVGRLEVVDEVRVEVVLARPRRTAVVAAMLAAHPYEEPAYDVVELAPATPAGTGSGRIGDVEPTTLGDFARVVAERLPATAGGVRVGGDPGRPVRRVAVCGGAGDFMLDAVLATDADVYVTSDLRHHPASEFLEKGGPALVDVSHWAAEWTWLPVVEAKVQEALGDTVETRVSTDRHGPMARSLPLKADPAAQLALLDLQAIDARVDVLRHQRRTLPELAEIAALEESRAGFDAQRRDAQILVDDLTAEQPKVDADVEQVKTRRTRDRDRMDQGLISNPKDLARMQGELESLERRITTLEDEELEVMARLEDAQKDLDGVRRPGRGRRRAARGPRQRPGREDRRPSTPSSRAWTPSAGPPPTGCRPTCSRSTTSCASPRAGWAPRCCGPASAVAAGSPWTPTRSPRSGRCRRTRSTGARSASGSWCAPPNRACDRPVPLPQGPDRGGRRLPRQPRPRGVRRGPQGRRDRRGDRRGRLDDRRRDQQRRGVQRPDRRPADGRGVRPARRDRGPDGLQARRRADVGPLEDQAPGHEAAGHGGHRRWRRSGRRTPGCRGRERPRRPARQRGPRRASAAA